MKVNFSALFSWTPTYPYLGQKSLYLSPLCFARRGLGNSDIFLIYYIAYMVTDQELTGVPRKIGTLGLWAESVAAEVHNKVTGVHCSRQISAS